MKDLYVHLIADAIRERTGLEMPNLENILSYGSFILPILAAICVLYLYHVLYVSPKIKRIRNKYELIRESEEDNSIDLRAFSASIFLTVFIGVILYSGYKDKFSPAIPGPQKYTELRRLSALELRERALKVSRKLDDLDQQYLARRKVIQTQFDGAKETFNRDTKEFEQKKFEYDTALKTCSTFPFGIRPLPLVGQSGLGVPLSGESPMAEQSCSVPSMPIPPTAPRFPVISVDSQWREETESIREEAAAVWEELRHRTGNYIQFFYVPSNYNDESSGIAERAKLIEDEANKLH